MTKFKWTAEAEADLKRYVEKGYTSGEISDEMGITRNMVVGKCRRMGLQLKSKRGSNKQMPINHVDKLVFMTIKNNTDWYGWGLEFDEIAEFTGLNSRDVLLSVKRLLTSKHINQTISNVADHIFFNDAGVNQVGA